MGAFADFFLGPKLDVREGDAPTIIEGGNDVPTGPDAPAILPPSRLPVDRSITPDEALGISMVYRAIGIHAIAAKQIGLTLYQENFATGETTRLQATNLLRRPDPDMRRSAFIEQTVTSLACRGNAYWRKLRGPAGQVTGVRLIDPAKVRIIADKKDLSHPIAYQIGNDVKATPYDDVVHLKLMRVPGRLYGLGPIQAAQRELAGTNDLRDYSSNWFRDSGVPSGVLTSDNIITPTVAAQTKEAWKKSQGGTRDVAVLGAGLSYKPVFLSPADAQFLESMQFSTTQIARMFGAPSSLMLAAVPGNSQTYQNVEQDWLGFVRFSNMQYLIEIEDALSELLPESQWVKFNIDALLRSDTVTRYTAHKLGIEAGFLAPEEARDIENLPKRTIVRPVPKIGEKTNETEA